MTSFVTSRLILSSLALLSLVLTATGTESQENPASPGTRKTDTSSIMPHGDSILSSALRLKIQVGGLAELSGAYMIGSDLTVSIPMIGRLSVAGLSEAAFERILSTKMMSIIGRETYATVEVSEYRPVYVTGYVSKPGATQWQPGMTVLQAVAMSGGIGQLEGRGYLADPAKLRRAVDDQKRALAAFARVRTEEQEGKQIEVPNELIALAGRQEAESLINQQEVLFLNRKKMLDSQLQSIGRGRSATMAELDGLREQSSRLKAQLALQLDQRERLRSLKAKGLVVQDRSLDQELRILELEEKDTNVTVGIARVQATIADMDKDIETLKRGRESQNASEKIDLLREMAHAKIEMDGALQQSYKETEFYSIGSSGRVKYSITRVIDGQAAVVTADEHSPMIAGDILVVSIDLP